MRLNHEDVWVAAFKSSYFTLNKLHLQYLTPATLKNIDKALDIAAREWYAVWVERKRPINGLDRSELSGI